MPCHTGAEMLPLVVGDAPVDAVEDAEELPDETAVLDGEVVKEADDKPAA